jgi:hypothetical protein
MRQYTVNVRLNGKLNHVQTGKVVTIPEIAVLQHVHGSDAVQITGKSTDVARNDGDERERLRRRYDQPSPDAEPIVDRLFGGPLGRLPTKLVDIGVDPQAQSAALAEQARQMADAATSFADEDPPEAEVDEDEEAAFLEKA